MSAPPAPPTAAFTAPAPDAGRAAPVPLTEEAAAPAESEPAPGLLTRLAWYLGAIVLAGLLATVGMQLWDRDLRAPFYYDLDAMLYLPLTRTVVEQGFWRPWTTDRLGAPGGQDLRDFPVIDFAHFFFLWLWGKVLPDTLLVYNAYSLMNYPLTALTAMWVLRWLRVSLPFAALGGILYAFLPYHQERYHYHYFLAAYWWVPVSLVPAFMLLKGDFPYFRRGAGGEYLPLAIDWRLIGSTAWGAVRLRKSAWKTLLASAGGGVVWLVKSFFTRRAMVPVALGVVTASAGAYYAFFSCACYAFAGAYAWVAHRTWRGAASAALVIAPVVAVGVAYHLPTFLYQYQYGKHNLTQRQPFEADHYGLKLAHLLLPASDHNVGLLANLRRQYASPLRPAEAEPAGSLGFIGGAGLVGLLAVALFPVRRRWPEGPLSALALFLVLLASIGALGSVFNQVVMADIRAYNRAGIFIGFLAIFAAVRWLDLFLSRVSYEVPLRWFAWTLWLSQLVAAVAWLFEPDWVLEPGPLQVAQVGLGVVVAATLLVAALTLLPKGRIPRWCRRAYFSRTHVKYPALALLLVLGYVDQTPWGWNPFNPHPMEDVDRFAERFEEDRRFFKQIEEAMPPGSLVFCLPYAEYPEPPRMEKVAGYEHARGYVMTDTLSWSYGAVKGREGDAWQREVTSQPPEVMLKRVVARGFDGLLVDGRGFPPAKGVDRAAALIARLNDAYRAEAALNPGAWPQQLPQLTHEDGRQFFLDLRSFRGAWCAARPAEYAAAEVAVREWVTPIWLDGFLAFGPTESTPREVWGRKDATMRLVNPTDRERTFDLSFTACADTPGPFEFALSGAVEDSFTLERESHNPLTAQPKSYRVTLPPGHSAVRIHCEPPASLGADRFTLCYFLKDIRLVEVK